MKLLIALYFFILAIIQMGLFFGINHYYRSKNSVKPSRHWMSSLLISVLGLIIFGAGIIVIDDILKPEFNFTVANTLFFVAAVLQALFCKSLNHPISRFMKISFSISIIIFAIIFEWMRNAGSYEVRTAFMCILASFLHMANFRDLSKEGE